MQRGSNSFVLTAVDTAGNESQSTLTVELDDQPPAVEIRDGAAPLADGLVTRLAVTLVVTVNDATPSTLELELDGAPFVSGGVVDAEGSHHVVARAVDRAGNAVEAARHFSIDRTPPLFVSLRPPFGSFVSDTTVVLEGEVDGAAAVTVDGTPVPLSAGIFRSLPLVMGPGETTFQLVALDSAGNRVELAHTLQRDATAPELVILEPPANAVLRTATVVVRGTVRDSGSIQVRVNAVVANVQGDAFTSNPVALVEGENQLVVEAIDAGGNRVEQRRIAREVAASRAGRDLDVLDELGEQLAALGVNDRLLVLGGCPF